MTEEKIYDDTRALYPITEKSSRHYGYHCGGYPYGTALGVAKTIAARHMDANSKSDPMCTKYKTIDLAVIPKEDNLYFVEDRSEYISPWESLR